MLPSVIKAFCIDFNSDCLYRPASPGLYAHADARQHVQWLRDLGVNTIQTFCVSYNGYAWYAGSGVAPVTPGMKGSFLDEVVDLGHREGMAVLGYFNLGANPVWEMQYPDQYHSEVNSPKHRMALTDEYLDYFCRSVRDALQKTGVDGFMIDWFNRPPRQTWLDCEKKLFSELMGRPLAAGLPFEAPEVIKYDRRLLERAWTRIKETVASTRQAILWTNHPFVKANMAFWTGHRVLREADWVLSEYADMELLDWLDKQVGPRTKIIQNLCGGGKVHDATLWKSLDLSRFGLYGFAQPNPVTTLPPAAPAVGREDAEANQRNIEVLRTAYHSLS